MEYRIEELAAAAGMGVDTIRFYQSAGLLAAPRREGRVAWYQEAHLERLRRIRALKQQRFTLAQIRRVLAEGPAADAAAPLLEALVEASVGRRTLTRAELAAEAGVPEPLVQAAVAAGLVEPLRLDEGERFAEADVELARSALAILGAGFPLTELLALAVRHAGHVAQTCEEAIDLFDRHVRRRGGAAPSADEISEAFRTLLPEVTRLVARHFQRTLVNRALDRLERSHERDALAAAAVATESARLEVTWK